MSHAFVLLKFCEGLVRSGPQRSISFPTARQLAMVFSGLPVSSGDYRTRSALPQLIKLKEVDESKHVLEFYSCPAVTPQIDSL